jgi:hypothetical protein
VDAFITDPLCFGWLQARAANESFLSAASQLADPLRLRNIRKDLPVYVFSGSEDPVGQQLKGVSALLERYRAAGPEFSLEGFGLFAILARVDGRNSRRELWERHRCRSNDSQLASAERLHTARISRSARGESAMIVLYE